jgi:hypothetical protein
MRTGRVAYERKGDAERALSLIEARMISGDWVDHGQMQSIDLSLWSS